MYCCVVTVSGITKISNDLNTLLKILHLTIALYCIDKTITAF